MDTSLPLRPKTLGLKNWYDRRKSSVAHTITVNVYVSNDAEPCEAVLAVLQA